MTDPVTLTQLQDANLDAVHIDDIANGSATLNGNGTSVSRLGAVHKTLSKLEADYSFSAGSVITDATAQAVAAAGSASAAAGSASAAATSAAAASGSASAAAGSASAAAASAGTASTGATTATTQATAAAASATTATTQAAAASTSATNAATSATAAAASATTATTQAAAASTSATNAATSATAAAASAAAAATLAATAASSAALISPRPKAEGYISHVFDNNYKIAFGIKSTGQTFIANPLFPAGVIPYAALGEDATALIPPISVITKYTSVSGWAFPYSDMNGKIAGGWLTTGQFRFILNPVLPAGCITYTYLDGTITNLFPPINVITKYTDASGWAFPFYDSAGHIAGGWLKSGQFQFNAVPVFNFSGTMTLKVTAAATADNGGARDNGSYFVTEFYDGAYSQIRVTNRTTRSALWVTTSLSNKTNPVMDWTGQYVRYMDDASGHKVDMYAPVAGGAAYATEALYRTMTGWGDSLSQGVGSTGNTNGWMPHLATMLGGGWTVNNRGITSETSTQIAARQGGTPVTLGAFTLPTSGSVNVVPSQDFLLNAGSVSGYPAMTGKITVAGTDYPGTMANSLSSGSGGTYSFTRTSSGSAVSVPAGTAFIPDDGAARRGDIQAFIYGRNNPVLATVLADVAASVAYLSPMFNRFIVGSVLPQRTETTGTGGRTTIDAINAALLAAYPYNYLDLASPPSSSEQAWLLANYSWSPTSQDLTDMAAGVWPQSLHGSGGSDNTHLNDTGYAAWAYRIYNFLVSKGWTL